MVFSNIGFLSRCSNVPKNLYKYKMLYIPISTYIFIFDSIDWNMEQRLFVCAYLQGFMDSSKGEWGLEHLEQNTDFGTVPNCSPRRVQSLEQDFGT